MLTQKEMEAITKIQEYEKTVSYTMEFDGWSWSDVGVMPITLSGLMVKGLVKRVYSSNSTKLYRIVDTGLENAHENPSTHVESLQPLSQSLSNINYGDLFDKIVGHDNVKLLLRESMQLDKPIHVLLYGPPAIAKTLFLWDIERIGGEKAQWLMGSGASKSGIWDVVAERLPTYLLVDELEKMGTVDMVALLGLMEKGRIVRTKTNRMIDVKVKIWVIATANRIDKIPKELLSRFAVIKLEEYNAMEFVKVVQGVVSVFEDVDVNDANTIALKLVGKTHDVRDAIRVARLSKRIGIDKAIQLLIR